MYYAHVHPDDTLMPVFPPKPVCEHDWQKVNVDYESFRTQAVIVITLRCSHCGKEERDYRQVEGH